MMEVQRMVLEMLVSIAPLARGVQHAKLVTTMGGMDVGEGRACREMMGRGDGRRLNFQKSLSVCRSVKSVLQKSITRAI